MYNIPKYNKGTLKSVEVVEGETLEMKIERMVNNKEPISDGAPEIFTTRDEGVISAYNIRTDRWEIATDAMDMIEKSKVAKREEIGRKDAEELKAKTNDPLSINVVENVRGNKD